jgi:hypothetical protein
MLALKSSALNRMISELAVDGLDDVGGGKGTTDGFWVREEGRGKFEELCQRFTHSCPTFIAELRKNELTWWATSKFQEDLMAPALLKLHVVDLAEMSLALCCMCTLEDRVNRGIPLVAEVAIHPIL